MSKVYSLRCSQQLPVGMEEAWEFFSSPKNLQAITPKDLGFHIRTKDLAAKAYAGQIIEYTVSPVLGIPLYWMTEITHVEEHKYFVDEQRYGPYSLWHHQHHFEENDKGVLMHDLVHYKLPFGFLGSIAHGLFVKKQLDGIFTYREKMVKEKWG